MGEQHASEPQLPAPEPPALERKDWLGAGGSVLAIALSVLGMNKEPVFRGWAVALMLLAAATGIAAIMVSRYRRVTTSAAVVLVLASVAILTIAPDPVAQPALVLGAAAPAQTTSPSPTASPGPQLKVSQLEVIGPDDNGSSAALDITVRNDGERVAVLIGVDLTINGFTYVETCLPATGVGVTGTYKERLPDNPKPGRVVRITLHQKVEAGSVDRFTVTLRPPTAHKGADAGVGGAFVYLVDAAVVQDGSGPAVDAGTALVEAGSSLEERSFYFPVARDAKPADLGSGGLCSGNDGCSRDWLACLNGNRHELLPLLAVPAARSRSGEAAATALLP